MQLEIDSLVIRCQQCGNPIPDPDRGGWVECECGELHHFERYLIIYGLHPDYQDNGERDPF